MRVLVLGMGRMGQAIAERLLSEHQVTVWDRSPHKAEPLLGLGAIETTDRCAALAGTEVAITSLSNDEAVREIARGDQGVLECIGGGIYIDASTISPALGEELARNFTRFVAMPIIGSPRAVRAGEARLLVGSTAPDVATIEPLLSRLSRKAIHYRSAPQAYVAKLATNLLLLTGVTALSEAIAVGSAGGLSDDELRQLFADNPAVSPAAAARLDAVMNDTDDVLWTIALGAKDLRLALDLMESDGEVPSLSVATYNLYRRAIELGLGEKDIAAIARLVRR